jgi:hypothetical protein
MKLSEVNGESLEAQTSASERLGMMWQLALDAWASSGVPLPTYRRSEMPGKVVRRRG